jgi:hypothetical protein
LPTPPSTDQQRRAVREARAAAVQGEALCGKRDPDGTGDTRIDADSVPLVVVVPATANSSGTNGGS